MKIHKNDTVQVITGTDKGKKGKVLKAMPKDGKVLVEGINMKKRHTKARRQGQKGEIVESAHPIHVSNVKKI
jgi:large subunit ribosomal protein L24